MSELVGHPEDRFFFRTRLKWLHDSILYHLSHVVRKFFLCVCVCVFLFLFSCFFCLFFFLFFFLHMLKTCKSAARSDERPFSLHEKYNTSSKILNFKRLATLSGCSTRFVSDWSGIQDRFSRDAAHLRNKMMKFKHFLFNSITQNAQRTYRRIEHADFGVVW